MHFGFLHGIFANVYQRQVVHLVVRIPRVDGNDAIGGTQGFHQLFIVAKDRGVIFIKQRSDQNDQQGRYEDIQQTYRDAAPHCFGFTDFYPPGEGDHQNTGQSQRQHHLAGHQGEAFRRCGIQNVGNHGAVNDDAEGPDKILGRGAQQNKQANNEAVELEEGGERGENIHHAEGNHRHAEEHQPVVQAVYRQQSEHLTIEREIEQQPDIEGKNNQINRTAHDRPT